MEKQDLLNEVKLMVQAGQLKRVEVLEAISEAKTATDEEGFSRPMTLPEVMYYIGGTIVFIGLCVLVFQNWDSFSSIVRILITLGSMIAAFTTAALLYTYKDLSKLSQAFFLIAGLLGPIALNVAFYEGGVKVETDATQLTIFFLLTLIFLGGLYFFRQTILLFFGIIFATAFFHFIVNLIVGPNLLSQDYVKVWEYRILADGLVWMLLGYYFSSTSFRAVTGALYGFGILGFLGAAIFLGGWQPNQSVFWELIYPIFAFGAIFLSVNLKSRSFLIFGSLFLIAYILKLTGEYFSEGLGWPFALVLAGLAIMGVGYYAVRINRTYLSNKDS